MKKKQKTEDQEQDEKDCPIDTEGKSLDGLPQEQILSSDDYIDGEPCMK